jgi:ornithine cyclodeaminase
MRRRLFLSPQNRAAAVTSPFYTAEHICTLLDYDGCIRAVRQAMADFTASAKPQPLRSILPVGPDKLFALMPGTLANSDGIGAKIITAFGDPDHPGRSAHRGVTVLFDAETGAVSCIADAGEITHIRTAAASAVATDALARPDATRLAIFGCGAQARTHVHALSRVRKLEEVRIWGRSLETAKGFAARMAEETGLQIVAYESGEAAARDVDIICTVTGSPTPVLLRDWVANGTHINAVGSSYAGPVEVDTALVAASRYIADSRASAEAAAAELIVAREAGILGNDHICGEIGEVLLGRIPGRTSVDEITFYKSLGHVVQDLAATRYLHARATGAPFPTGGLAP